jgi:predicted nucleic acid-binding protein
MKPVFADTGFWIALLYPKDRWHTKAITVYKKIEQRQQKVVTSEMVLTEFMNFFSKFDARLRQEAGRVVQQMRAHPNITVIAQNSQQFQQALNLYLQRPDKAWSLTDCSSFLIMGELNLTEALAHDKHFKQAGFITLLEENI